MTANIPSNTPESEKNEWRTPPEVFAWALKILGKIDFDAACTHENRLAKPIWMGSGGGNMDALDVVWYGNVWCNPPYSKIEPWVEKAIGSSAITAMLIPSPNGEERTPNCAPDRTRSRSLGALHFYDLTAHPQVATRAAARYSLSMVMARARAARCGVTGYLSGSVAPYEQALTRIPALRR